MPVSDAQEQEYIHIQHACSRCSAGFVVGHFLHEEEEPCLTCLCTPCFKDLMQLGSVEEYDYYLAGVPWR